MRTTKIFSATLLCVFFIQGVYAQDRDSKSVPKPILMLGLYCNAANISLKRYYDRAPLAPPWRADGRRAQAFNQVFSQLDYNYGGNAKALQDKALTRSEITFLTMTAQKEANIWGEHATTKCGLLQDPSETEVCLRNLNSEVFKCFQQLEANVEIILKNP